MTENAFVSELGGSLTPNHTVEPAEIVGDQIDSALAQFTDRAKALIAAVDKRTIGDNDELGKAADLRSMIDALQKTVWDRAGEIARPHTQATNTVKARTQRWMVDLGQSFERLTERMDEFRRLQRQRAAEQAEEQRQREAELRAKANMPAVEEPAVTKPVALAPVQGDYGSRVSDRAVKEYTYADVRQLPLEVLNAPGVAKAIQTALRAYAKLNPDIPGVTTAAGVTTSHRRPN